MKWTVDEELWYGAGSDDEAEAQAARSMAARVGRVIGTKPFPIAAQRLMLLTQKPNCTVDEIVAVLETDPALCARLLRLVNSVGYSLRTACTSVRHAATLVGIDKLNQVASTAAILDMFDDSGSQATAILRHTTVVGSLCRYLAFHFALPADELFTCGFLHDIGKLMLLDTESDYGELLRQVGDEFDRAYVLERQRYGFDHALLAGHVLAAWNIPDPVPKVVAWHHHVTRAYADSTLISQMVNALRLADALSYALDKEDAATEIERLARSEAASYLDISEPQIAAMWDELRSLAERARQAFDGKEPAPKVSAAPRGSSLAAPSATSLRPSAKTSDAVAPKPARRFPCVVCQSPSYAHTCLACSGYVCPEHVDAVSQWCALCVQEYEQSGIPRINPLASMALGAAIGALVAASILGAMLAGTNQPVQALIGPSLVFTLLGLMGGVGYRWARRFWFLRNRPNRRFSKPPKEVILTGAALGSGRIESTEDEIRAIDEHRRLSRAPAPEPRIGGSLEPPPDSVSVKIIPASPGLPRLGNTPLVRAAPSTPPPSSGRAQVWMSARPPTPVAPEGPPASEPPRAPSKPRGVRSAPATSRRRRSQDGKISVPQVAVNPVIRSAPPAAADGHAVLHGPAQTSAAAEAAPSSARGPAPSRPDRVVADEATRPRAAEAEGSGEERPASPLHPATLVMAPQRPPSEEPAVSGVAAEPGGEAAPATRPSVAPKPDWDAGIEPHDQAGGW